MKKRLYELSGRSVEVYGMVFLGFRELEEDISIVGFVRLGLGSIFPSDLEASTGSSIQQNIKRDSHYLIANLVWCLSLKLRHK
jgi:hypothetical protein